MKNSTRTAAAKISILAEELTVKFINATKAWAERKWDEAKDIATASIEENWERYGVQVYKNQYLKFSPMEDHANRIMVDHCNRKIAESKNFIEQWSRERFAEAQLNVAVCLLEVEMLDIALELEEIGIKVMKSAIVHHVDGNKLRANFTYKDVIAALDITIYTVIEYPKINHTLNSNREFVDLKK